MTKFFADKIKRGSAWCGCQNVERAFEILLLAGETAIRFSNTFDFFTARAVEGVLEVIEEGSKKIGEKNNSALFKGVSHLSGALEKRVAIMANGFKDGSLLKEIKEIKAIRRVATILSEESETDKALEEFIENLKENDLKLVKDQGENFLGSLLKGLEILDSNYLDKILSDMVKNKQVWEKIGISSENLTESQKSRIAKEVTSENNAIAFEQITT